jgi:hypothetical protein
LHQEGFHVYDTPGRKEVYTSYKPRPVFCCQGNTCRAETPEEVEYRSKLPAEARDPGYVVPHLPALPCHWQVKEYHLVFPTERPVYYRIVSARSPWRDCIKDCPKLLRTAAHAPTSWLQQPDAHVVPPRTRAHTVHTATLPEQPIMALWRGWHTTVTCACL